MTRDDDQDYAAIEAAVMETARGRWFLAEYARRNRQADTKLILEAIEALRAELSRESGMRAGEVAAAVVPGSGRSEPMDALPPSPFTPPVRPRPAMGRPTGPTLADIEALPEADRLALFS